jgi:hypothetical protein
VADLVSQDFDNLPCVWTRIGGEIHHGVESTIGQEASERSRGAIGLDALD